MFPQVACVRVKYKRTDVDHRKAIIADLYNPHERRCRTVLESFWYTELTLLTTVCSSRGSPFQTRFISAFLARRLFA